MSAGPSGARDRRAARHRTALAAAGLVASLALAVLWLLVVPDRAASTAGVQRWMLRFGHSLCWVLLAATAALVLLRAPRRAVAVTAWAALAAYAGFLAALVL